MADLEKDVKQVITVDDSSATSDPKLLNCRGTHAQFLRENPRFLNDPICRVVPTETSRDVEECLSWGVATTRAKPPTRSAAVTCLICKVHLELLLLAVGAIIPCQGNSYM